MKLEKFNKNKKRNRIIFCSIVGILLIVGSIALIRTYAFYESKKEFNVLKGQVPPFSQSDIQLAFTINGEKGSIFPAKESRYVVKNITCEDGVTAIWDNNIWGLKNINANGNKKINCSVDFKTITEISEAKVGDYVSYTPEKTSYDIPNDLTGCIISDCNKSSFQTINPSELKLWRVIRKNDDGTIDLVSEYASSTGVYFYGKEGYKKYIGTLNTIASAYETSGVTSDSRYMGYYGQTEEITDESMLNKTTVPWADSTTTKNNNRAREKQGGGGGC